MGVEYQHCFFARDLARIGDQAVLARVHDVLTEWEIAVEPPAVYDIDGGRKRKQRANLGRLVSPPRNLLAEWPMVDAEASVERIMGPSYYPASQIGGRYFQQIMAVAGTDFRIFAGGELLSVEVHEPPVVRGRPAEAYDELRLGHACHQAYPGDAAARPPRATIRADARETTRLIPEGFNGIWRAGMILDCGKDLPAMAGKRATVPNTRFARDLADAFGAELVQIGFFY